MEYQTFPSIETDLSGKEIALSSPAIATIAIASLAFATTNRLENI